MACNRRPQNHTQLDNGKPTASYDCGVEKTRDAIDFASCGRVDVGETKLRELMGKPGKQATNPPDWKRAIESDFVAEKFKSKGLRPPKARLLDGVDIAIARKDLDAGRFLIGAGWYATLNELAPRKSASRTFGDNHAFGVFDPVVDDRTFENDPLADGRRASVDGEVVHYPKGTQPIKWPVLRAIFGDVRIRTRNAAGAIVTERKLGRGQFLGISVARSKPTAGPVPGPVPPEPVPPEPAIDWPAEAEAASRKLGTAYATIERALTMLEAAAQTVDETRDRLDELVAQSEGTGS